MLTVAELAAKLRLKLDEESWKKGEAAIGALKGVLAGVGITAAAIRGAVEAVVAHTASAAVEASKAAQRVGMTREAFQGLDEAAKHTGFDGLETSLKFLNRSLYDATHGGHETRMAFHQLGIEVGKGTKIAELMPKIADAFSRMSDDDPRKVALAMRLFGRAGNEMIPFLNKGSAGIAELEEHAHKLGLIFTDEDVAAAFAYKRANIELHASIEGLQRSIGRALLPHAGGMARAMAAWVAENREWIATGISRAIEFMNAAIKRAKLLLDPFIAAAKWLTRQTWLWKAALWALGIVLVSQFGRSVRDAAKGAWELFSALRAVTATQALGAAMSIATGLLWAAGIFLIVGAIEELYGWITGDRETLLGEYFGKFSDFMKEDLTDKPFVKGLRAIVSSLVWLVEAAGRVPGAIAQIKRAFGSGDSEDAALADNMRRAFEVAGAGGMESQWKLSGNARFSDLARRGDFDTISREFGGGKAAGPVSVQFGDINLGDKLPDGASMDDLKTAFGSVVDDRLRGIFDPAYEAVAR